MVQGIFNLTYIQALCVLSCNLKESDHELWKSKASFEAGNLSHLFGVVMHYIDKSKLYKQDSDITSNETDSMFYDSRFGSEIGRNDIEDIIEYKLQQLMLPFLRIAALLRHHIYEQDLPFISTKEQEFLLLAQYLSIGNGRDGDGGNDRDSQLSQQTGNSNDLKAHDFLFWVVPTPLEVIYTWCEDLCNLSGKNQYATGYLMETQHLLWEQPKLLELNYAYDGIFQYYHRKQCTECGSVPKDPSICLVCGTLVCLRESCCKNSNVCEATKHSVDCGAGTAIFLCVSSSTIVVIRGKRACLWGSVYLDCFGEEDRELK